MNDLRIEVEEMVDGYYSWLRKNTNITDEEGSVELTTPFLDRHNDYLEVVVSRTDEGFRLSDDGYIISDLKSSGVTLESAARKQTLNEILNGFGVRHDRGVLYCETNRNGFAEAKHGLLQAMLTVNDLCFGYSTPKKSLFPQIVGDWLGKKEVPHVAGGSYEGRSGFIHRFDYVIPKSKEAPERMLRTMTRPDRASALNFIALWSDVLAKRGNSKAIALLNDGHQQVTPKVIDALKQYNIDCLPWSQRDEFVQKLVA